MSVRNFSRGNLYYARRFECDCEREIDLKFELRSKSTDRSKPFLAIQCNLNRSIFSHNLLLTAHLVYRSKVCERKMRFLKEGYKTASKAIVSLVKNRWPRKWTDERLEHSFGNVGPMKYKIGDCIKQLTFLGLHVV